MSFPFHEIGERCDRSRELASVVIWSIAGLNRPTRLRLEIAGDAATLAVELHGAVWVLIQNGHYAAAHALLRPLMETTTRALWLIYAAEFQQVELLVANERNNDMGDCLRALRKKRAFPQVEMLWTLDQQANRLFHSFTHGGFEALRRRADGYQPNEIFAGLLIADLYLLIATDAIAVLHEVPLLKPLMKEAAHRLGREFGERFGTPVAEAGEGTKDGLPPMPDWNDPR